MSKHRRLPGRPPPASEPWPEGWAHLRPEDVFDAGDERYPHKPRLRKPPKPSLRSMVAAAEKIGKNVTSVTYPNGTKLHFGVEATADDASAAWDEALTAKRRADHAEH